MKPGSCFPRKPKNHWDREPRGRRFSSAEPARRNRLPILRNREKDLHLARVPRAGATATPAMEAVDLEAVDPTGPSGSASAAPSKLLGQWTVFRTLSSREER